MAKFKYVAIDLKGKSLAGEVEADDLKKAKQLIRAEGITPLKVTKVGGSEKKSKPVSSMPLGKKTIHPSPVRASLEPRARPLGWIFSRD